MGSSRLSSLDSQYISGDLSNFPLALDDKNTLYEVKNNAFVPLVQTLTYTGQILIVQSTEKFPDKGEIRVGPLPGVAGEYELIYYDKKTGNTFQNLKRGFAGSQINYWPALTSTVSLAVMAEHHNAIKDAVVNMEVDLGLKVDPDAASLNGILKAQEIKFLAPKPLFRAFPIKGPPPLQVRFQNFTTGQIARFLWDFGDGGTSIEKSPIHTFVAAGKYTVKLNVVTTLGAQGIATKANYIEVNADDAPSFFYVDSIDNPYSVKTATQLSVSPKEFVFVDQTDGDVIQRNWIFDDGNTYTEQNPDKHQVSHIYSDPGEYIVTELVQFSNGRLKRNQLSEPIVVI